MSTIVHPGNVVNECLLSQMCASLGLGQLHPDDLSAALVEAALQGQPFRIGGLVDQGADVNRLIANERFNHAVSPLACAASAGHASVVCALLRRGADPNLSVGGGMTVRALAL